MITLPLARTDALPDGTDYFSEKYDGCEVSPSCLDCPLSRCRLDNPLDFRGEAFTRRNAMIWRWRTEVGLSVLEIARQLKLAKRTVYGILARGPYEMSPLDEAEMTSAIPEPAVVAERGAQAQTAHSRVLYESV